MLTDRVIGSWNQMFECPICLDVLHDPVCAHGHLFCRNCISSCLAEKSECPLDRHQVNKEDILEAPRYVLSGINE
jgi:hypothetical protein